MPDGERDRNRWDEPLPMWEPAERDARWDAVLVSEREATLRFGFQKAPWESVPDYVDRITKSDPHLSLANAGRLAVIFRAAYDGIVALDA